MRSQASSKRAIRIALVGCGYVADLYIGTIRSHPELEIAGVTDKIPERAERVASYYSLPGYPSLRAVLDDRSIQIVVNLTNPESHYAVSRECLESDKHVYSEKPLATTWDGCKSLVELAERRHLYLASAPCITLGETALTIGRAIREGEIGQVLLAYADLDEGFLPGKPFKDWRSKSGSSWPWQNEFQVGCTLEHAAYQLSLLAALFGPAESVTAFSSSLMREHPAPDLSVASIRYVSGVVARLTCSILAPKNQRLTIVGDKGVLWTQRCWDYLSTVRIQHYGIFSRITDRLPVLRDIPVIGGRRYPHDESGMNRGYRRIHAMDFARGIAEIANALSDGQRNRLPAQFCLHINELALAIHNSGENSGTYHVSSTFDPAELLTPY